MGSDQNMHIRFSQTESARFRRLQMLLATHISLVDCFVKVSLSAVVLGMAVVVAGFDDSYPTYTYRYRLTVNIEVAGELHSGSSVIEVTWRGHPKMPGGNTNSPELRGEAAVVDLGDLGLVVATLTNAESYGVALDGAWGALWIAPRAFGFKASIDQMPDFVKEHGKRDLTQDNLPRFVWFPDPKDPMTAQKVLADKFPTAIGPPVHFVRASVEITDDPVVIDIWEKLPWLRWLEQKPGGQKGIRLSNGFSLSRYMFIGERSTIEAPAKPAVTRPAPFNVAHLQFSSAAIKPSPIQAAECRCLEAEFPPTGEAPSDLKRKNGEPGGPVFLPGAVLMVKNACASALRLTIQVDDYDERFIPAGRPAIGRLSGEETLSVGDQLAIDVGNKYMVQGWVSACPH